MFHNRLTYCSESLQYEMIIHLRNILMNLTAKNEQEFDIFNISQIITRILLELNLQISWFNIFQNHPRSIFSFAVFLTFSPLSYTIKLPFLPFLHFISGIRWCVGNTWFCCHFKRISYLKVLLVC